MKSEQEIKEMINNYDELIVNFFSHEEDREDRERIKGKIYALNWVLGDE